jgi:hypothetical protein
MTRTFRFTLGLGSLVALGFGLSQACSAGGSGDDDDGAGNAGQGGLGFTGSSSNTTGFGGGCAETVSEAIEGLLPADIIVAVDNSGSMDEEAAEVQASMNDFAAIITGSNIDAHIVMISADSTHDAGVCVPAPLGSGSCPDDENLPVYRHLPQVVQSTDSLQLILSTYDQWKDSLRPGASRTIAVISDDNSALDAAGFTQQLLALDASFQGFKFDAIVAPYELGPFICMNCPAPCDGCDPCCGPNTAPFPACIDLPAEEGTVYKLLVAQTGGVLGDLCVQDFQPVFHDMATAVVGNAQIACVYDIPDPGDGQEIATDLVNVEFQPSAGAPEDLIYYVPGGKGDCGANGGWYYDDPSDPRQIIFCDSTCATVQASTDGKVTVTYGCETVIAPPE